MANIKDLLKAPSNVAIDAIRKSNERVKQLEKEVEKLKRELAKYKTQNVQQRQRIKSLQGQLNAEKIKVTSLQKGLRIQKTKTKQARAQQREAEQETVAIKQAIKNITPKLTKDQLFEMYRSSNLTRFWERVQQVTEISPEKLAEMQAKMASWSCQQLRDIIRVGGWRSTWYDSDANWNSAELSGWDERNLYAFIMSY